MVVVYIILFILFLSMLVMFHELGHLLTAKMFNVYCFEYAIGFGPKLLSFKRKQGETYFSIRAIPFGGFVSMYGESESVPEDLVGKIDENRSILKIKKWKRAIIMSAGVIMNFILAILMFFIYEIAFPVYTPRYGHISVANDSTASQVGLKTGDFLYSQVGGYENNEFVYYDNAAEITYSDETSSTAYLGYCYTNVTYRDPSFDTLVSAYERANIDSIIDSYSSVATVKEVKEGTLEKDTNYLVHGYLTNRAVIQGQDEHIVFFVSDKYADELNNCIAFNIALNTENKKTIDLIPIGEQVTIIATVGEDLSLNVGTFKQMNLVGTNYRYSYPNYEAGDLLSLKNEKIPSKLSFKAYLVSEDSHALGEIKNLDNLELKKTDNGYKFANNTGISMLIETAMNDFPTALGNTFVDFGNGASVIFRSLGSLFTDASAWSQVGGIVAIGVTTSQTLADFGFGRYLFFWALISVNLGIVNLLPFPGLDGWQLLVTAIEGIFKKEIPNKVKSIVSFVGIALLFVFMIAILIKDVVGLFI